MNVAGVHNADGTEEVADPCGSEPSRHAETVNTAEEATINRSNRIYVPSYAGFKLDCARFGREKQGQAPTALRGCTPPRMGAGSISERPHLGNVGLVAPIWLQPEVPV